MLLTGAFLIWLPRQVYAGDRGEVLRLAPCAGDAGDTVASKVVVSWEACLR